MTATFRPLMFIFTRIRCSQSCFDRSIIISLLLGALLFDPVHAAETRSYVVGWFSQLANSEDNDCPAGINPDIGEQYRRNLVLLGFSREEAEELVTEWVERGESRQKLPDLMIHRGRLNGEPVNAYAHPSTVIDPKLNAVEGEFAYGFNLDGEVGPDSFTHPETGEQGIDHQLFRALGCIQPYRGTVNNDPTYWTWAWTMMKDSMPAWVVTVSGEDLTQDGDVTVRFDRALEHVRFVPTGGARAHMTYRQDPDPRWHNIYRAELRNGVITINEPGELNLLKDPLSFPELNLSKFQFRLELNPDGTLKGVLGGYQPWHMLYFAFAQGSFSAETMVTGDLPGMYYLMRRLADGDPDPETGQNRAISVAYRIHAVPAFFVTEDSDQPVVASIGN